MDRNQLCLCSKHTSVNKSWHVFYLLFFINSWKTGPHTLSFQFTHTVAVNFIVIHLPRLPWRIQSWPITFHHNSYGRGHPQTAELSSLSIFRVDQYLMRPLTRSDLAKIFCSPTCTNMAALALGWRARKERCDEPSEFY